MLLFNLTAGITWVFSYAVKRKLMAAYGKWGKVRDSSNASGAQTAHAVLTANELRQVHLLPVPGELSDHYDPRSKTIRLSETVYDVPSVAAMT